MKKSTLNAIVKNYNLMNLFAIIGILSLTGIVLFPFLGLFLLAFLSVVSSVFCFVFITEFESKLYASLKQAKNELGLSIFTNDKALLKKCLQVKKSI